VTSQHGGRKPRRPNEPQTRTVKADRSASITDLAEAARLLRDDNALLDSCADCGGDGPRIAPLSATVEAGWLAARYRCPAGHHWDAGYALTGCVVTP
jgi:hypothetical protein